MTEHDYDYLIIGSGFGGSVSALRLAEKGWKVAVVEQGRRIGAAEIKAGKSSPRKLMWLPKLGLRGYFVQHMFRHVSIVGGVGVGGGSIVWGAVMLPPKDSFYADPTVASLGIDLKTELAPHLKVAHRMLGVNKNPKLTRQDELLELTAKRMGAGDTFGSVPNAIFFGEADKTIPDPYFDGAGPERTGCNFCGGCLTGCEYNAKNSLYLNYLYLAEQRGVNILPERKASRISPLEEGGYRVDLVTPGLGRPIESVTAGKVIVASGVIGTLQLLFRNRDTYGSLPNISPTLGKVVRTNSEAITAVLHPKADDMTDGTAISSDFYPDANTHITQNRVDRGYRFFRFAMGPLVDGEQPKLRALRTLLAMIRSPALMLKNLTAREWEKRITIFTVMQDLGGSIGMEYKRRWWWPFTPNMGSRMFSKSPILSYLPVANETTRVFAEAAGGTAMNTIAETLMGQPTTAHILSGCPMGKTAADSVVDVNHEVHGTPGLYVVDGSTIPGNIGVNPSLTITAMAERFAALQPLKT